MAALGVSEIGFKEVQTENVRICVLNTKGTKVTFGSAREPSSASQNRSKPAKHTHADKTLKLKSNAKLK